MRNKGKVSNSEAREVLERLSGQLMEYLKAFKNRLGEHCSGLTKFISSCCKAQARHSSPLDVPSKALILSSSKQLLKMFLLALPFT